MNEIKITSNGKPVKVNNNPPARPTISRVKRKFMEKYKPEELATLLQEQPESKETPTEQD